MIDKFWSWYNRHYLFTLTVTSFLFVLQTFHLYWLFTDVVLFKITGQSFFIFPPFWGVISTVLDYTEIPALISTSLVYINQYRLTRDRKNFWYLIALNIQWLHLFWITDQVVIEQFGQHSFLHWGTIVAWIAILIDYAELPVMYDTAKKTAIEYRRYFQT
ncbi:MAG: hypothetical protein KW804_01755 [Candidatus Doudnabacteria bacterium]|nr:hypothetical protein [Candidatus Doudnabacteria bacterium]